MKAIYVESIGDSSKAIYVRPGENLWRLLCVINVESAECNNHSWPKTATDNAVLGWRRSCTWKPVKFFGAAMMLEADVDRRESV